MGREAARNIWIFVTKISVELSTDIGFIEKEFSRFREFGAFID